MFTTLTSDFEDDVRGLINGAAVALGGECFSFAAPLYEGIGFVLEGRSWRSRERKQGRVGEGERLRR